MNPWRVTDKGDPVARDLADRHYTRQSVGAVLFTRPGYNYTLVLARPEGAACWVWWRPKWEAGIGRQDGLQAIECTIFRNETRVLSSALVRWAVEALGWVAARRDLHGETWPKDGLITGVQSKPTSRRRGKKSLAGKCYREAGWVDFPHPSFSNEKRTSAVDVWLRYSGARPPEERDPQRTIFDLPPTAHEVGSAAQPVAGAVPEVPT